MKIRSGFVANSSSSSFIISCAKIPVTHKEAREVWFRDNAKFIPEIVSEFMFENLKPFELSIEKIKEYVEKYTYSELKYTYPELEYLNERNNELTFIKEITSDFYYEMIYDNDYGRLSIFDEWLCDELNVEPDSSEWFKITYNQKRDLEDKFFKDPEVEKDFKLKIESKLMDLTYSYPRIENPVYMQAEIEDCGELGSEVEHNTYFWEKFPSYIRFSHH